MMSSATPMLRLDAEAMRSNIQTMDAWCATRSVELAPHIKTTMSRQIVAAQLAAGARGVTVATADQAALAVDWGAREVLVANTVVDEESLRRLATLPATVRIFVDSIEGVRAAAGHDLGALVDVGTTHNGRGGVRTIEEARAVALAVVSASGLRLEGVAGYEGVVPNDRGAYLKWVEEHCALVRAVFFDLLDSFETTTPIFSLGGSAYPDRAVAAMPTDVEVPGIVRLLRSGCYVTHDHGTYAAVSPIDGLLPALTVRTLVTSLPEPGLAVLNAGKRDLPYDAGLPVVLSGPVLSGPVDATIRQLYDHHAVLVGQLGDLRVGDTVDLGISHPCSAFDRWPRFVVTDGAGVEVDVWETDFSRLV
jgi:D-serine deaminase-like pyridoxal phosphate-dependent protein